MDPIETKPKEKESSLLVAFSILVSGMLIAAGRYYSPKAAPVGNANSKQIPSIGDMNMRPISTDDHIYGNPNAEVFVIEYSDTECPFCKTFHQTMKQMAAEYTKDGKVAWVYRHFPIKSLHSKAPKEAEATECAAELGGNDKFWEYLDQIFTQTNSNDTLDPSALPAIAKTVGLDVKKFNTCLSSGKYANKVAESVQDAMNAGGEGTPNTIIMTRDGQKVAVKGAQSYEVVKTIIDAALKAQTN